MPYPVAAVRGKMFSVSAQTYIEKVLGYPTHDPHGSPIPTRDGQVEIPKLTMLAELKPGQRGVIRQVSDDDAEMLNFLGGLGMYPGTGVEMLGKEPYGGPLLVKVSGTDHAIGSELATHVYVSLQAPDDGTKKQ